MPRMSPKKRQTERYDPMKDQNMNPGLNTKGQLIFGPKSDVLKQNQKRKYGFSPSPAQVDSLQNEAAFRRRMRYKGA